MNTAWRSTGTRAVLILLLTIVAYLPVMRAGFIWDDDVLITENSIIKSSDGLRKLWFTTEPVDYWPLTSTVWWLEWRLWANNPLDYHVINVLLHAANAVLAWTILRRLRIAGAWLAALIFAIHPVNVATVAWISEQKNTISMCFYLIAILLYLRFDDERRWCWYACSLAAFLFALLSKTAIATLPVVLLGCIWWRQGRVHRVDIERMAPFFAVALILGLVTIWFQHRHVSGGYAAHPVSFNSRLAVAGWIPWFYMYKTLLPLHLIVIYPKWEIDPASWVSYVPGVMLLALFLVLLWKRNTWGRPLLFALGYFVATLFPVLGWFDQRFHRHSWVADHWLYFSMIGVIALVVGIGLKICRATRGQRVRMEKLASVLVLCLLLFATWKRSQIYASEETLWRDTVARNPNAWVAQNNLALVFWRDGRIEDAIACLKQGVRINPGSAEGHSNLGNALAQTGQFQAAIEEYEQALRIDPNLAEADYNLANTLSRLQRFAEAIAYYKQAVRLKPDYAEAHYHLGVALERSNKREEARSEYERALRLNPDYKEARDRLKRLETGG